MAEKVTCYITRIISTGAGFAVRGDNDEGVYIHKNEISRSQAEEMDEVEAILVVNQNEGQDSTPWYAPRIEVVEYDD
jgi:cold shock CspA family protein